MKSNAALWEVNSPQQLQRDLESLSVSELKTKYQCTKRRLLVACDHFGIDKQRLFGIIPKYNIPPKEELIAILANGKQFASKHYGCSITVINKWIQHYNIEIRPYHGRRAKLSIDHLSQCVEQGLTDRQIAQKFNTSAAAVRRLGTDHNIVIPRKQDEWQLIRQKLHNSFEWIKQQNQTRDILSISQDLQITHSTVLKFLSEHGYEIVSHSYNKSRGEIEVVEYIKSLGLNPVSIKKKHNNKTYEIDCFIESHCFGIEYCGEYWHSDIHKPKTYHQDKQKWCAEQGISLMTVFEHEWTEKQDIIKSMIKSRLGVSQKIFARDCSVQEIPPSQANEMLARWHIQGSLNNTKYAVGLYHNNRLISVMTFTKPRFTKDHEWEIARYATELGINVVGGASKLFKSFVDKIQPKSCISYCDLRFGQGHVYEVLGFTHTHTTPPGYFYIHQATHQKISRFGAQKHKLVKLLDNFDPALTEYENMASHKYLRVWDCGNNVFEVVW